MKNYKLYLFDFDGTLVDSALSLKHVFVNAFKTLGIKIGENDHIRLMRIPLHDGFIEERGQENDYKSYVDAILYWLNHPSTLKLTKEYPEIKEVLKQLKTRGAKLGIVTSNSTKHVDDVLDFINMDKSFFDVIIGSDICHKTKPDPTPVNMALAKYKMKKSEVVYVGDSINDAEAGKNAGVDYLLLDRLNEYQHSDYKIIYNLEDLLA